MKNANFVISIDFELHWGVFDTLQNDYDANILGGRDAIKKILDLFKEYDIHATWAVVGFLFNESIDDYYTYKPTKIPSYKDESLNSYKIQIGKNEDEDKLHYANSLIKLIKSYPNQEIASHSYSHYYTQAEGQTIDEFEEDVKSAVKVACDKFDIELKSFVFPQNEVNIDYLKILKKYDFCSYRGNPCHWIYQNGHHIGIFGRTIRFLDSYFNVTGNHISSIKEELLLNIEGNRLLKPYKTFFLNKLMLKRIKSEMKEAAKNNKNYHLWWHPHNFGLDTQKNIDNLEIILMYFKTLKQKYNIQSKCMDEFCNKTLREI